MNFLYCCKQYKTIVVPVLYLISGFMLILGNISYNMGLFFYFGILLVSYLVLKRPIFKINIYCFLAPYFIMLAFSVWNNVFPYYIGIVLAVLLGDLFVRILYSIIICFKENNLRFLIIPSFLFLFDFIFYNIPGISFIHMIPIMSPLSTHSIIIKSASIFGGRVVLLLVTSLLSATVNLFFEFKSVVTSGIIIIVCALSTLLPSLMSISGVYNVHNEVSVASVQGSYILSSKSMNYENYMQHKFQYYISLTEDLEADIVVFPETELGLYDIKNKIDQKYRKNITDVSKALKGISIFTVTEGNSITKSKDERYISSLVVNNGEIIGITRKRNLVPFSETKNYSKGKDYDVYDTPVGRIGISICYDINEKTVEKLKNNGAQIILAPFNDSSFGRIYHNIHRYFSIIKAAECAIPIVVANEDGISQIIDYSGKIIRELGYGQKGAIFDNIELKNEKSIYSLYGKCLEWFLFLVFAVVIFINCFHIINLKDGKLLSNNSEDVL